MRTLHTFKYLQPAGYTRRSSIYIDRDFQVRHTYYVLALVLISNFIFIFPIVYFANQNYSIYYNLADLFNPLMAEHLSREQIEFNLIFSAGFIGQIIFWYLFLRQMTAKMAAPAKILRNHIRILSRGDYTLPNIRLRVDDEFKELINSYNYLYILLKTQMQQELDSLLEIKDFVTHPMAHEIIEKMIEVRALRLDKTEALPHAMIKSLSDEEPGSSDDSHRAS